MSDVITTLVSKKSVIEENFKENTYSLSIIKLENDELIGNCSLFEINNILRCAKVSLYIGDEENRNKGYGKEVLKLLLDYGFNYLNINNIMLYVYEFNENAFNMYKKVGFKEIGRRRQSYFLNGKYYDVIYMDMLASEFKSEYIKNKNIN